MKKANDMDVREEASRRFMDGALKERFLADPKRDKSHIDNIVSKVRASGFSIHKKGGVFPVWTVLFKGIGIAASIALVATVCVHFLKSGFGSHQEELKPFLLTASSCKVYEGGAVASAASGAKKLRGDEILNVAEKGSAFVIFPDLVKLEVVAGSSLKLVPDEIRKASSRFPVAQKRDIVFADGIFRLDTSSTRVVASVGTGSVSASDAKLVLINKAGSCYGELVRGTALLSLKGKEGEAVKVSAGDRFILGSEIAVSRKGGATDKSIAGMMPQVDAAKKLLIDNGKYDNLLIDLLNRSAGDICVRQDTVRRIINAL